MFIKKRPQNRQFKGSGNYCTSCDRSLQEPFIHCSLGCKVKPWHFTKPFSVFRWNDFYLLWWPTLSLSLIIWMISSKKLLNSPENPQNFYFQSIPVIFQLLLGQSANPLNFSMPLIKVVSAFDPICNLGFIDLFGGCHGLTSQYSFYIREKEEL